MTESLDNVNQIDCNNPSVDCCVITRFSNEERELLTTQAGRLSVRDELDGVPYSCPLTKPNDTERLVEDFAQVCADCPHSSIWSV